MVVGAYPEGKDYDTNTGMQQNIKSVKKIKHVPLPKNDPVLASRVF